MMASELTFFFSLLWFGDTGRLALCGVCLMIILVPPVAVLYFRGCGKKFLLNVILCICTLMIGGIIHAAYEAWLYLVEETMG